MTSSKDLPGSTTGRTIAGTRASVRRRAALLLGAALAAWASGCGRAGAPDPALVVLVTVDTLRHDGLARMPRTRAFGARGLVLERFHASSSSTQPTHASLLTGLQPWEHGVTRNGLALGEEHTTLAERLRAEGFATSAVVASFPLERRFGLAQGFERYDDRFAEEAGFSAWNGEELHEEAFYSLARDTVDRALAALAALRARRGFLWVHLYDPHAPYGDAAGGRALATAELERQVRAGRGDAALAEARELYDRDLLALDGELERLWAALEARAAEVTTHVVFTSDHGEGFGELGSIGHGDRVTDVQVRVPFFVVSPRVDATVREDPAGATDAHATLLDLAGVAGEPGAGRSLLAPPAGEAEVVGMRRTFAAPRFELRADGTSAAVPPLRFFAFADGALYAGDARRVERNDGSGAPPPEPLGSRLRARFASFEAALETLPAAGEADAGSREALRALGYTR